MTVFGRLSGSNRRQHPMWLWKGQWRVDEWFNRYLSVGLFLWALWLAVPLGHSVVGVFNRRADAVFVGVLRKWYTACFERRRRPPGLDER
jgi:hypothetical protein